jgi:hypothetical protein
MRDGTKIQTEKEKILTPKEWLQGAYAQIDHALGMIQSRAGITVEERKEMEDYIRTTDDKMAKLVWLLVTTDGRDFMAVEPYDGDPKIAEGEYGWATQHTEIWASRMYSGIKKHPDWRDDTSYNTLDSNFEISIHDIKK